VSGVEHPPWCKPRLCTAAVDGLPFAEGEHRSENVRLATEPIVWPVHSAVVSAYLTQRTPSTSFPTTVFIHFVSNVHGVIAHLPLDVFFTLVGQLAQLAQVVVPPAGAVPTSRPTVRYEWPLGARWADTQPGGA
jgi:hypothetical protein